MDFSIHVDPKVALAIFGAVTTAIAAVWRVWPGQVRPQRHSRSKVKPDVSQLAAAVVSAITGTQAKSGEELPGSVELRKALCEAKEKAKARSSTRGKRSRTTATK